MTIAATKTDVRDHDIKVAIEDELSWTPSVTSTHIGVGVTAGAVTLSGEVNNYPEKHAAVKAAQRVRGVTAVADEIVVHHEGDKPTDADIARNAASALDESTWVPKGTVKIAVHDRVVTLTGAVPWYHQRLAAEKAVRSLRGVRGVNSFVTVSPNAPVAVSPTTAKQKITAALVRNAHVDARHINVKVAGNKVILSGTVCSWFERSQAERTAWNLPGVESVENQIKIDYNA